MRAAGNGACHDRRALVLAEGRRATRRSGRRRAPSATPRRNRNRLLVRADDFEPLSRIGAKWACDRVAFSTMTEPADVMDALVPHDKRTKTTRMLLSPVVLSREAGGEGLARFRTNGVEVELIETKGA